ncbi:MAG: lysozyme [Hyphomonadaceae bacterium]|nr:lysozyme [Hyphomonadaceae bacterium]
MALNMRTSQAGLDVIKAFEGFRAQSELLPNGRWIIGYGHLRRADEGVTVTETEAEALLREYDLPPVERFVMRCVLAPLMQNEFDALVSLAFNIGSKSFASSDVVAGINGGNRLEAAHAFDLWRRAKIGGRVQVVDALVRRRAAEKALFLNAPGRHQVASSRLYRAMHDKAALPAPPKAREILVEHFPAPEPELKAPEAKPAPEMTPTEAAAESVRQQMVRILGENSVEADPTPETTDGTTPEEIAAAISELAGESEGHRVQKSVWPQMEDLPPPPFPEPSESNYNKPPEDLEPIESVDLIDDLEEVEVSQESIDRAVEINEAMEAEDRNGDLIGALPFGLLALIGAALGGYGVASQFGMIQSGETMTSSIAIFLPLFLIVLGVLLFITMTYYFLRTLLSQS